jgi:hypothetical protein
MAARERKRREWLPSYWRRVKYRDGRKEGRKGRRGIVSRRWLCDEDTGLIVPRSSFISYPTELGG